jgi:hypothetical protein
MELRFGRLAGTLVAGATVLSLQSSAHAQGPALYYPSVISRALIPGHFVGPFEGPAQSPSLPVSRSRNAIATDESNDRAKID